MSIIPTDPINAFLNTDQTLTDRGIGQLRKTFQTYRSEILSYGLLETGKAIKTNLSPSTVEGVRPVKRPLIPFMIKIIPPDLFPSGTFTTTRIPSPQNVELRLIRTSTNLSGGNATNVSTVVAATSLVPSQDGYVVLNTSRIISLQSTLRDAQNNVVSGQLPLRYESSNPSIVEVSDSGEVTFLDVPRPPGVIVTIEATRQDGTRLTGEVLFTSDVLFVPTPAQEPNTEVFENPTAIETLVSEGVADDQTEFLSSLKDRYETLRSSNREAENEFRRVSEEIVQGREEVTDLYLQRSALMKEARGLDANERFLRNQVEAVKALPPLFMYINPSEFSLSYNHRISEGNKSREGYIIEHWGLEQPSITASGMIGATYVTGTNAQGRTTGGLTRKLRRGSAAYQSFMSLFHTYKSNGYIFNLDDKISILGAVQLFYGDTVYTGTFTSFSIQETETQPFTLSYSFTFSVRFIERIF